MLYKFKQILRKVIPYKFILLTHKFRAVLAAIVYGSPGKKIRAIGVAGTKGKTTTTNMITKILEEGGHNVAMLSTANFQIGEKKWLNDVKLTTTSPFYFQKFLKKAVKEKCDYVIVEISSHGLVQYRHLGVPYKTVVLTNMMSDHLDYHKTYENYKYSHNALLTKNLENLIINYDDENLRSFFEFGKVKKYAFSLKGYKEVSGVKLIRATDMVLKEKETEFNIKTDEGQMAVRSSLIGEFNVYNSLAATAVGLAENIKPITIKKALESIENIPGRLEKINEGQDFEVIIDYAHSPDSLKKVYEVVKPHVKNKMIAVLGGTGDRDKTYRAKMGALAEEYADIVIITNEDPYSEDPEDIMDQVMSGIKNKELNKNLFRISDRKEAVKKAMFMAERGDLVIITGKGAEQFMVCGEKKIPWDDREVARGVLKNKMK
ncbi:MAG: UDP-N-acetylmuramoyl-L-alanyl-D-glutamate--2,6-diaminopimelate ligase [Candidatus Pacebacteria bacterium]|nr:UDP-N-acetylmuramoyl-L-alanyl-D-glutamate--2,6-diaminopimelate ligase [Candidatus Paceibacterota bacterium]